jgi:hypothetical protein
MCRTVQSCWAERACQLTAAGSAGRSSQGCISRDSIETATAEWYRSLAEWGLAPQDHVPYDHHEWRLDLRLADLSEADRQRDVALPAPSPDRRTWPEFQQVGERLWRALVSVDLAG